MNNMTAENATGDPVAPPRIASISPFHEILTRDISASLPPELGSFVSATSSLNEMMDWIAAGAMLRWVTDANSRKIYLEELRQDPRRASVSLAKAIASRMDPPAREPEWRRLDLIGLILQLVVPAAVLGCRALLTTVLGFCLFEQAVQPDGLALIAAGFFDLPVLLSAAPPGLAVAFALLLVAAWHALEVCWAPHWMESVRQFPLRLKALPPSTPWRLDTFQAVWLLQSAVLWVLVGVAMGEQAFLIAASSADSEFRVAFLVILGCYLALAWLVFRGVALFMKLNHNK